MKIAIVGDIHITLRKDAEWEKWRFVSLVTTLQQKNYDKIIFAGDIFESPRPSLDEIHLFYTTISTLTAPLILIQGNHEQLSRKNYTFDYLPSTGFELMDLEVLNITPKLHLHLVGHKNIKKIIDIDLLAGTNILVSHIRCNIGMIKEEIRLTPIAKMFDYVILGDIHQRFKPFENIEYTSQPYTSKYDTAKDTGYLELNTVGNTYEVLYKKLHIPNKIKVVVSSDKYTETIKSLNKGDKYKVVVTGSIAELEGLENFKSNVILDKEVLDSSEDLEEHLEAIKNSGVIDFESKLLELTKIGYELTPSHLEKGKEVLSTIFKKIA